MKTVVVIGAGMSGLTAARHLAEAGLRAVVLDKGRAVGGRMATRRIDKATFDHGAQHISVRTEPFARVMEHLVARGTARVWLRTSSLTHPERGIEERYAGEGGMRRIPEDLARGLDVTMAATVEALDITERRVRAIADGRVIAEGDAVVLTPPVPQVVALLAASGVDDPVLGDLEKVEYDATLAVMATLDGPSGVPDGHLAPSRGDVAWIADNHHKQVSAVPALTIHSSPEFAAAHLDGDARDWVPLLLDAARPHHEGTVIEAVPHRWRYSQPRQVRDDGAVVIDAAVPVVLAGEVFAGARVEGAFRSGVAAAELLSARLG
ncbi:MAG: FAD-dependent oxidoreductase [Acidimicrobiia bacterium]|nr:FAD-dependent oxidoreductase [Acidimicrobiia bacterium]